MSENGSGQRPARLTGPPPGPEQLDHFLSSPLIHAGLDPYRSEEDEPIVFFDPLQLGPFRSGSYGAVYFETRGDREDTTALFELLEVKLQSRAFVTFEAGCDYEEVRHSRYLNQRRIVSHRALLAFFETTVEEVSKSATESSGTIGDALFGFIDDEISRWGLGYSWELNGTLGGDGDWAKETLSFGFMVEDANMGVYRIWSRPWLVTK